MNDFNDFLKRLALADWHIKGVISPEVIDLLRELGIRPHLIWESVAAWSPGSLDKRQLRCHETTTHYKWFIYYHKRFRYRIWLHQYKSANERRLGYAEVPHNHRYSFASLILHGGFHHHIFNVTESGLDESGTERQMLAAGDVYTLHWDRIHKLSSLLDKTITLVVESPTVRNFSEAYDDSGSPQRFYDFAGLHPRLSQELMTLRSAPVPAVRAT